MNTSRLMGHAAVLFLIAGSAHSQVIWRTVALTGDAAPGQPGLAFAALSDPRINDSGQVAFRAKLAGSGVTPANDGSIWSDRSGSLELVLREGGAAPNGGGATIGGIPTATFGQQSLVGASVSFLNGSPTQVTSLLSLVESPRGQMNPLLVESQPLVYSAPAFVPLGPDGEALVWTALSRNNSLLFTKEPSSSVTPATPVPGAGGRDIPAGSIFRQISPPTVAEDGSVVFRAAVGPTNTTSQWQYGLFRVMNGELTLIAVTGQQVAGAPTGQTFREMSDSPVIVSGGETVFWAQVQGTGAPAGSDTAIFRKGANAMIPIVRAGQPAPGTSVASFAGFSRRVAVAENGRVAFIGYLQGGGATTGSNSGVWVSDPHSDPFLLVREGGPIPGLAGATLTSILNLRIGPSGGVVITATIAGPGVSQLDNVVLLGTDRLGGVRVITRVNQPFWLEDGSVRAVREIDFDQEDGAGGTEQLSPDALLVKLGFADNSYGLFLVSLPCFGDFNNDGGVDQADVEAFFDAWSRGDMSADCTLDGGVDGLDVQAFYQHWESGGC